MEAIPLRKRFKLHYSWIYCKRKTVKKKARAGFRREWWSKMYKYDLGAANEI